MRYSRNMGGSFPVPLGVMEYKADYLRMLMNIRGSQLILQNCAGLIYQLTTEDEIEALIRSYFPDARDDKCKVIKSYDISQVIESLALSREDSHVSTELARIEILRRLLDIQVQARTQTEPAEENQFLAYLTKNLKLSADEKALLFALYLKAVTSELSWIGLASENLFHFVGFISCLFAINSTAITRLISPVSKLVTTGLLTLCGETLTINPRLIPAISGQIDIASFQEDSYAHDAGEVYDLNSFDVSETDLNILTSLLKSPGSCNILFYGKPGCGKTELARALIRHSGSQVLHVTAKTEGSRSARMPRLRYCTYFAQDSAIIVDEAELVMNTGESSFYYESDSTPGKSVMNNFLDSSPAKIIWILNEHAGIHESTLRRFQFKLRFERLTEIQRRNACTKMITKHRLESVIDPTLQNDLVKATFVTPGLLDNIMRTTSRLLTVSIPNTSTEIVSRLLTMHADKEEKVAGFAGLESSYDLSAINTSFPLDKVIRSIHSYFETTRAHGGGLNILLYGLPGSGKSEFAKYLAAQTGRELMVKRGSDLHNMYVGGTEKLIANAFAEVDEKKAILLIDEADTFFLAREHARQAYEISHTNEFLNRMENHRAVLICCTNLLDKFDSASLRRFHFKVQFFGLLEAKRREFFLKYFADILSEVPDETTLKPLLRRMDDLTPGDFRAVKQRCQFAVPGKLHYSELIREIESEITLKRQTGKKVIGFT